MKKVLRIIYDNIRSIITGDYEEGKTDLNTLGNLALIRIDRKTVTPSTKGIPRLSIRQKKAVKKFYSPYVRFMTDRYHRIYTNKSGGKFYPEYLPEELYVTLIDRYFSDREEARFLDNKCYYYRLFSNVKLPELVGMRIGSSWMNNDLQLIPFSKMQELIEKEDEVVVKRAVNSEGGFGVDFLSGTHKMKAFNEIISKTSCDLVIQKPIRQHPQLSELHKESVNTMRIVSLLTEDKVKIYAVCLKIGVGKERVDNGCHGGIYCGVHSDGSLGEIGALDNGEVLYTHPDLGYRFSDKKVPCLGKAIKLVKQAHSFLGHFRLVSWDIAIDEEGDAVLVEANLSLGGIDDVQVCTGPLFGKDTKKILDEVFGSRKRKWTTLL